MKRTHFLLIPLTLGLPIIFLIGSLLVQIIVNLTHVAWYIVFLNEETVVALVYQKELLIEIDLNYSHRLGWEGSNLNASHC